MLSTKLFLLLCLLTKYRQTQSRITNEKFFREYLRHVQDVGYSLWSRKSLDARSRLQVRKTLISPSAEFKIFTIFRYRCNPGTQMEGRDTVACTGRLWNGTVPACNGKEFRKYLLKKIFEQISSVEPNKPKLELLVSGSPVKNVKVGDVVKASCQSRGGNPVPEVGLLLDDEPYSAATQAFREFSSHFTFLATTEFNGKTIKCITRNKIGTTSAEKILTILSKIEKMRS